MSSSVVFGAIAHLDAGAVRLLDHLEQVPLAEVRVGDDQLVDGMLGEHGTQLGDLAEGGEPRHGQAETAPTNS